MELDLEGRRALVTGASQGIGRRIALALAAEGATVVLAARRAGALAEVAAEVEAAGASAVVAPGDVTTAAGCDAIAAAAGDVDILVNNAGKGSPRAFLDLDDGDWLASFELNLFSAVRLSRAVIPGMRARRWGRIVNISSRVAREPDPYFAPYAASKAALINLSKCLAGAYSRDGVLTNCVVPGLIHSEAIDQAAAASAAATGRTVEEVFAETLRRRPIPAGRIGEPDDVAGLVAFLCSERAAWITGACFTVDGGITRGDR